MSRSDPMEPVAEMPAPPPEEFGASGLDLWDSIAGVYALSVAERLTLVQACRTVDRLDRIHSELAGASSLRVKGKSGTVTNPLLVEGRQQAALLTRLIASLRIPEDDGSGTDKRPQRRGAARGAYKARADLSAVN